MNWHAFKHACSPHELNLVNSDFEGMATLLVNDVGYAENEAVNNVLPRGTAAVFMIDHGYLLSITKHVETKQAQS